MGNRDLESPSPFLAALAPAEYAALVAVATGGSVHSDAEGGADGPGSDTAAYVEHRLVLLGLAIRVADAGHDGRSGLILSTAGRTLVNDVARSHDQASGEHDFGAWSPHTEAPDR